MVLSYHGGDGNDVTLTAVGDVSLDSTTFGSGAALKLVQSGLNLDLINTATSATIDSRPVAAVTSYTVTGADGASNDSLTVDFSGGYFVLSGGITFNGGTGATTS